MSTAGTDHPGLRHVIVAGGSAAEWAATAAERWAELCDELGKVADHVGANWLTLRPFGGDGDAGVAVQPAPVGGCLVTVDAEPDGRRRLAATIEHLRAGGVDLTERNIAAAMNEPAQADPDLVVVLGPPHRLPPSLVWELAYSELVFVDVAWPHLAAAHLTEAIDSFTHRHRRFGGVD